MTPALLFEDGAMLVCVKPRGVLSQSDGLEDAAALLQKERPRTFLQPAHRLDREAGGVLVLAKTPGAAAALSRSLADGAWDKEYLAVLRGVPETPADTLRDLLFHDARRNRTFVVTRTRRGVREAALRYETVATRGGLTLVRIALLTGRTHQIRAQFSARGLPLYGDGRYGGGGGLLGLWCARLTLPHPRTGAPVTFVSAPPTEEPFAFFSIGCKNTRVSDIITPWDKSL